MKKLRWGALLLSAALLIGPLSVAAVGAPISRYEKTVSSKEISRYERIRVTAGQKSLTGYLIEGTTYVPLRALAGALTDASVGYNAATKTATLNGKGLSLSVKNGAHILYVNGRCLYLDMPAVILSDGSFYLPVRPLGEALSASVGWNDQNRSVTVKKTASGYKTAADVYDENDLYWLSRIISAESRGEPFLGQVAVGNVVLNRVKSKQYPNSIYGVIFDKKNGIQFTPAVNGSIYKTPTNTSIEAAKVCLEGYTLSESILFFFEPSIAESSWISKNRPFAFRLGAHHFYN